eukprot:COSAG01_NODE_5416_length_4273_cov_100.931992_2_plen_406_part_00
MKMSRIATRGGGDARLCLRDGDITFFFGKFVVEAKKGELGMRKAATGKSYIKTSVLKLAGFDAKEDADPDHDDDRDDDDDDDDDRYAYADKMLERLRAKSRGKLGDKAEQSPDEVRVLIFAKGRSSAPQIVTSGSELLTALQTLRPATASGSSCGNGAGEFTVSLPAAGSLKKHKKKEGKKKKSLRKKSPSFSDSDDSKSCASSSNSDDVTAGFSSGKGGASDMRREHIDECKLDKVVKEQLVASEMTSGPEQVMGVRKYIIALQRGTVDTFLQSQSFDGIIDDFQDVAFLSFFRRGCGEGPAHAKNPPIPISEAGPSQLASSGVSATDVAFLGALDNLGGTAKSEEEKHAAMERDKAAANNSNAQAAKAKIEAAAAIMPHLEGAAKEEVQKAMHAQALALLSLT